MDNDCLRFAFAEAALAAAVYIITFKTGARGVPKTQMMTAPLAKPIFNQFASPTVSLTPTKTLPIASSHLSTLPLFPSRSTVDSFLPSKTTLLIVLGVLAVLGMLYDDIVNEDVLGIFEAMSLLDQGSREKVPEKDDKETYSGTATQTAKCVTDLRIRLQQDGRKLSMGDIRACLALRDQLDLLLKAPEGNIDHVDIMAEDCLSDASSETIRVSDLHRHTSPSQTGNSSPFLNVHHTPADSGPDEEVGSNRGAGPKAYGTRKA